MITHTAQKLNKALSTLIKVSVDPGSGDFVCAYLGCVLLFEIVDIGLKFCVLQQNTVTHLRIVHQFTIVVKEFKVK